MWFKCQLVHIANQAPQSCLFMFLTDDQKLKSLEKSLWYASTSSVNTYTSQGNLFVCLYRFCRRLKAYKAWKGRGAIAVLHASVNLHPPLHTHTRTPLSNLFVYYLDVGSAEDEKLKKPHVRSFIKLQGVLCITYPVTCHPKAACIFNY